jgi:hypothetical protein
LLATLPIEGLISSWFDRLIKPGDERDQKILIHLRDACSLRWLWLSPGLRSPNAALRLSFLKRERLLVQSSDVFDGTD